MRSLARFKSAQADPFSGFDAALSEITSGRKRSHWIWYVFPQLSGLGRSPAAERYGIQGRAEAEAYLRDALLRDRLLTITKAAAQQLRGPSPHLDGLMGSGVDALKLVSSLTLFGTVARELHSRDDTPALLDLADTADQVLEAAASRGYSRCRYTLEHLGRNG